MKRIIIHWTAGGPSASRVDLKHYHFVVEQDGTVKKGVFDVSDNESTRTPYAAHTRGCNTGSIGVSLCGMYGARERPFDAGPYPVKFHQVDAMCHLIARLCFEYDIPVTRQTVLSHAEVESTLGIKQRGKWDIIQLPFMDLKGAHAVGDWLRDRIQKIVVSGAIPENSKSMPVVRRGDSGPAVERLQDILSVKFAKRGVFGLATDRAVRSFQKKNKLAVDGIVGPMTWSEILELEAPMVVAE